MKLHYRKLGETGKPLFIIHGLFGSSDNWQTLAKKFAEKFQVYLIDQRNHGRSPHSIEFDYDLMVSDLHELITDLNLEKVNIIGHSMGGKTAIGFAAEYEDLVDKMVVVDISHKQYPRHHDQILNGLQAVNLDQISSRSAADDVLKNYIEEFSVRQFLLKNLYWIEKGRLDWRMNVPVLASEIDSIIEEVYFSTIDTKTLFIRGEKSDYILESDYEEIYKKFPDSTIHSVPDSGHWVHAEAPSEFFETSMNFLDN